MHFCSEGYSPYVAATEPIKVLWIKCVAKWIQVLHMIQKAWVHSQEACQLLHPRLRFLLVHRSYLK